MRWFLLILLAAVQACASFHTEPTGSLIPTRLCCEYLEDPLCIDEAEPRLSWALGAADPEARGLAQTAYRVLVAGGNAVVMNPAVAPSANSRFTTW